MKNAIIDTVKKHFDVVGNVSIQTYKTYIETTFGIEIDPSFFHGYQTILTVGLAYPSKTVRFQGKGFGLLSRYSYGTDYHIVMRKHLLDAENELKQFGIMTQGNVDISPIHERVAAMLSGIGYIGKNDFLIHPIFGSYIYLGTILITEKIEEDDVQYDSCFDCTKCIDACPSNALTNGFDESKCISGISQEKKPFDDLEISYFKTMIYGCDICQKVCPKNKGIDYHLHSEFEPSGIEQLSLIDVLQMSNKEYYSIYKDNASSWRGPLIIKRNALCLMYNQKQYQYIDQIKESIVKYSNVSWYNETAKKIIKRMESE